MVKPTFDYIQSDVLMHKHKIEDIGDLNSPIQFKGSIATNSDFPTSANVENGWFYTITADVTDDDATKTNTGQSFQAGDEIVWNGTNWTVMGQATKAIAENTVQVKAGVDVVAGEIYNTIADAITYVNTQSPAIDNQWVIVSLDKVNSESFTLPNYTQLTGGNGFAGITTTIFSGSITLGEYSILNSIYTTGQITAGSTNAAASSIVFGSYMTGTIIVTAGTYFQPVNTLLQLTSDLEVNGQVQILGGTWLSNTINVNAGGIFVGYIDMFGTDLVNNGGTIIANSYGQYYDNTTSGLTADTVNEAIDELDGMVDTNISDISTNTSDISDLETNKADKTDILWEINETSGDTELKTPNTINIRQDNFIKF